MQWANLPGRDTVNAGFAKSLHPKLILRRVMPRPHQEPEVGRTLVAKQIIAQRRHIPARIAQKQIAPLRQRGHETRLVDAAIFLRREQHARVTRMHRECEHAPAEFRHHRVMRAVFQRSEIQQQLLCVVQSRLARRLQPAELSQIIHANCLQHENNFSEIESLDFRQFLHRPLRML